MRPRLNPRQKKPLTIEQLEKRQRKAVQFAETFLHDDVLANELRELTPEQYAERRGISIQNPQRKGVITVANRTSGQTHEEELEQERDEAIELLEEAQEALDDLQDRIDDVLGEYEPEEEEESEQDTGNED